MKDGVHPTPILPGLRQIFHIVPLWPKHPPGTCPTTSCLRLASIGASSLQPAPPFVQKICGCRSAIVVTIVYTNCNGSGSAALPVDNTKTILTAFLAKRCRVATCTSAMAKRSVIIASLMTSLLRTDPSVSRASSSRVCR